MQVFQRRRARRIEPIFQTSISDCALACVAMILQSFGSQVDREGVRDLISTSTAGVSVSQVITAAASFGLRSRAVRADLLDLRRLELPVILHWDFNHFVVLESASSKSVTIIDPSKGRRRISIGELSNHYTGIAIEFAKTDTYHNVKQLLNISIVDLWQRIAGVRSAIAFVTIVSFLIEAFVLIPPILFGIVVDEAVGYSSRSLLYAILIVTFVAYCGTAFGELLRRSLLLSLGTQLSSQVGVNLTQHLLQLPFGFFQQRRINDLLSRIESIRALKDTLTEGTVPIIVDGIFAAVILGSLTFIAPYVGAVCVLCLGMYTILKATTFPLLRRLTERSLDTLSEERGQMMDSLRGIQTVKVLNGASTRLSAWQGANHAALQSMLVQQRLIAWLTESKNLIAGLEFTAVVGIAASDVLAHHMSVGMLFAVVTLSQQFQLRAFPVVENILNIRLLGMRLERLADIVRTRPEAMTAGARILPFVSEGAISVQGVSFRYDDASPWILRNVNLTVSPGEFVAIRGKSGEGKSTLMRVLLGLLLPEDGKVVVDNVELSPQTITAFRSGIGAVLQDDQLFSGTLSDNISGFDPDASIERVVQAARLACIHDDICIMPLGYFSTVGDMGSSLSGGQRQRLLLARALYRHPKILFLDEGTANLDNAREAEIANNLRLMKITIVSVAHRARLLEDADRVLELRDGVLVDTAAVELASDFLEEVDA